MQALCATKRKKDVVIGKVLMDQIVTLSLGGQTLHLFSGFSPSSFRAAPLHAHPYPEVHLFLTGAGRYTVEGRDYPLGRGDVILIPAGALHATAAEEGSRILVFQTDIAAEHLLTLTLPEPLLDEILGAETTEALSPSLHYLLARLSSVPTLAVSENRDVAYLIHEYVEANYHRPLRLSELAELLHLSERQTQREIRRLTGGSFSELLRSHRMAVAHRLARTTEMTAAEIAAYVGYETYSGFRRAFLKG